MATDALLSPFASRFTPYASRLTPPQRVRLTPSASRPSLGVNLEGKELSMRTAYVALSLFLMSGCATIPPVTLQHPTTGQRVKCDGGSHAPGNPDHGLVILTKQGRCISDYQRQGYERVPE